MAESWLWGSQITVNNIHSIIASATSVLMPAKKGEGKGYRSYRPNAVKKFEDLLSMFPKVCKSEQIQFFRFSSIRYVVACIALLHISNVLRNKGVCKNRKKG